MKLQGQLCNDSSISPSNQQDYWHESKVSTTGVSVINIYGYITIDLLSRVGMTFNSKNSTTLGNSYLFY